MGLRPRRFLGLSDGHGLRAQAGVPDAQAAAPMRADPTDALAARTPWRQAPPSRVRAKPV